MLNPCRRAVLALAVFFAPWASNACAELKPPEVGIIGMAASEQSKRVAEHYAAKRGIPKSNIFMIEGKPTEDLPRRDWDATVRPAIRNWLLKRPPAERLRCVVTVLDVPLRVGPRDGNSPEVQARKAYLQQARTEHVAKLIEAIEALNRVGTDSPVPLALRPDTSIADIGAAFNTAIRAAQTRISAISDPQKQRAFGGHVDRLCLHVGGANAVLQAMLSRADKPAELAQRIEFFKGYCRGLQESAVGVNQLPDNVPRDSQLFDLAQKHTGLVGVVRLIDNELEVLAKNETQASFDSELAAVFWPDYSLLRWLPNPLHYGMEPNMADASRATLMVSRLAAPTVELTLDLVDQAIRVEEKGLDGTVYLDARGITYSPAKDIHGSYGEYDESLRDLADRLRRHTKLDVVLDNKPELFGPDTCPKAALYCGWYSLGRYIDSFIWRPGAVGYHLASSEAVTLTKPGSPLWCNAMLERGVAATIGPTFEPYLVSFPMPDEFFPLLLTGKYSLGETYWMTTPFVSWAMVLVGDPLYNPFKKNPPLAVDSLPDRLRARVTAGDDK